MSDRHDTHIDDLFKQKLGNYTVPPPPSSWQQISKVLPRPLPFYQRPRFIGALVGLALLVGSGVGYLSHQPIQSLIKSVNTNKVATNKQVSNSHASSVGVVGSSANNTGNHTNGLPPTNKAATNLLDNAPPINTNGKSFGQQNLGDNKNLQPLSHQQKQHRQHITDQNKNGGIGSITVGTKHTSNKFLASNVDNSNNANTFDANSGLSFGTNLPAQNTPPSGMANALAVVDNVPPIAGLDNNADAQQQTSQQVENSQLANEVLPIAPAADAQNIIAANQHPENSKTTPEAAIHKAPAKHPTIRDKKGKILFPEGLTLGVYYNFNNTWIFSPSALKGEQNLHQQLTFGRAHALSFGYDFNPRFAMSLDWVIKSYQGQVFDYVTHMHLHAKNDVRLTYTHFPLLFKYKFNSYSALTRQPMVLNCIAGLEYGSLKAAEINVPNRNLQNDILRNHSWGFVLGADYDVYLTDNYYLTFGVRSSLTTGANKGEFVLPTNSTTNNLLIGGKVGLNYRFVHK